MQPTRQDFFSGTALAYQKHRQVGAADLQRPLLHLFHRARGAEYYIISRQSRRPVNPYHSGRSSCRHGNAASLAHRRLHSARHAAQSQIWSIAEFFVI